MENDKDLIILRERKDSETHTEYENYIFSEIEKANKNFKDLSLEVNNRDEETEILNKKINDLENEITNLKAEITKKENDSLKSLVSNTEKDLNSVTKNINQTLKEAEKTAQRDSSNIIETLNDLSNKIDNLKNEINTSLKIFKEEIIDIVNNNSVSLSSNSNSLEEGAQDVVNKSIEEDVKAEDYTLPENIQDELINNYEEQQNTNDEIDNNNDEIENEINYNNSIDESIDPSMLEQNIENDNNENVQEQVIDPFNNILNDSPSAVTPIIPATLNEEVIAPDFNGLSSNFTDTEENVVDKSSEVGNVIEESVEPSIEDNSNIIEENIQTEEAQQVISEEEAPESTLAQAKENNVEEVTEQTNETEKRKIYDFGIRAARLMLNVNADKSYKDKLVGRQARITNYNDDMFARYDENLAKEETSGLSR